MSINLGGAIVPLISAFAAQRWGWQAAMLIPGAVSMVLGLWLTQQLTGTPQEEGLPSVGQWRHDPLELRQEQQSPPMGLWQMLRTTMLKNPMIWLLGVSYVLVYLIRIALNDWGNLWLTESHGVNLLSANATVMLFEIGGLLGALFAGWGSDVLFGGQRAPMILLFTLGLMVSVVALWLAPVHHYALLAGCFFTVGFFVFGPQMLIGLAAVECGHKGAAGSITGFSRPVRLPGGSAGGLAAVAGHRRLRLVRHVQFAVDRRRSYGFIADAAADGERRHLYREKDKTMKKMWVTTLIASGIALATLSGAAHAKGRLVVYCSATNEMCEAGDQKPSARNMT